ncbi:hypothetical protein GCM10023221_02070 [Luteimicrobium xylanilyticum]|uniref:Uncharacterized protein n=1 Tax=Luteimicrobium xylanilyticum TaxID=1133546 RepID=A0A5P9Q7T5_9MICO|nr:hypothetical protein [Luteimicrobium xylanilyticum]QFU97497.1 hypothetical protein KDY119_00995 [Luteimicrobium xylanilyticum]
MHPSATTSTSGDAPLDAIAAIATLLLALGLVVPSLHSAARRRRTGDDARGGGPAVVAAGVGVLVGAAALVAYELGAGVDWSDALLALPMISVLLFVGVIAAGLAVQARRGVLGMLAAFLALAGNFVLVSTIMSALMGSVFGEYPGAPSCTAATCAWGAARGWGGIWTGVALLALCWLVGRLTRRARPDHEAPDRVAVRELRQG